MSAELDKARADLQAMLPDAVKAFRACLRPAPPRHAQVILAAAKEVFNRVGLPAVAATTVSNPQGGPVEITLRLVKAKTKDPEGVA
jgi:hypothetical protein